MYACKKAEYSVQIIEKWQDNGRTSSGTIELGQPVLRRKRETERMLKLRTVYPYNKVIILAAPSRRLVRLAVDDDFVSIWILNEKVDICADDKNVKRFKNDYHIVGKLFPSLSRLFQRDQICRHDNKKRISILN